MPSDHPNSSVLAAFSRGDLPPTDRVAVAEHLNACDTCCAALGQVRNETLAGLTSPSHLQNTNPASAPSDPHFAPLFDYRIPPALVNHAQYRIIDQLGEGGMGVVYKAEHRMMGRIVALKVLAPHLTANPAAIDRFLKEVAAAGRLSHPNIVISHDAGEAEGSHFLVMEFVEGISLDRLVARRGPLAVPLACQFARQIALGLQHAAEKGMVHRDIKPQNLMVTRKGQVKILDFGLARLAREADEIAAKSSSGTAPNLIMGTPDYLSPEQAKNSHTVDIRSDLYSLGCTLYFLLTGRAPFAHATTLIDKLLAHTQDKPEPVAALRLDVPEELTVVLAKLMAKKAKHRYATPAEAAAALAPFTKGVDATPPPVGTIPPATFEVVEAMLVPPAAPTVRSVAELPAEPETLRERKTRKKKVRPTFWARRRKLIAALAGLVILGLIAGASVKRIRRALETGKEPESARSAGSTTPPAARPEPKVLFVLPSYGLWTEDYLPVRQRLEEAGVKVFVASGPQGISHPAKESTGRPITADYYLKPELEVSEFAAIVFVGRNSAEFARPNTPGANAAATVIEKMKKQNRKVFVASGPQGISHPAKESTGRPITADYYLKPELEVSEFAAIVFVGRNSAEFARPNTPGANAAATVIEKMKKQNRVLAAICEGQAVLAMHGVLNDKSVAAHAGTRDMPAFRNMPINWQNRDVVVDGRVVTASRPSHAVAFADALVKVLRAD